MNFDIVSYAMGQKAAGGGGSGGEKTLWDSGWIQNYGNYTEVDGNTVDLKSGGTTHRIQIAPPATIARSGQIIANDTVVVAVKVNSVSSRVYFDMINLADGRVQSANGLFIVPNASQSSCYANKAGEDVLTFTKVSGSGSIKIEPYQGSSTSSSVSATIEVTGIEYNGTLIYGSVTPPNP